jgi:NAD(P)-dependent dehydrogenase (short-subunit alcohol dehydrogenase family)
MSHPEGATAPVNTSSPVALIIGAGSHIGRAALALLQTQHPDWEIVAIARRVDDLPPAAGLHALSTDHSEAALQQSVAQLAALRGRVQRVIICLGVLHNAQLRPEKRLEDLQADTVLEYLRLNAVLPALWLKHLLPLLTGTQPCSVAVLSARVGSIADNRKGGWYGYRASKAALNMLLQTTAIEYGRRAPNVSLLAYHPGTVDTPLSAPFHRSVPEGALQSPAQTAACLLTQMALPGTPGSARFVDYAGESVPW